MFTLDRQSLTGLWAAIPTPWDEHGSIDNASLATNCERLASMGVDGIYMTDSDGEFYAIELAEFQSLVRLFAETMEKTGLHAAMGVTWTNTQGIIDRIKTCCDAGLPNVHVAYPFFMPMAPCHVDRFWEDLARAAPEARWVHYAHPRCGPRMTGHDYARLVRRFPEQLIGTKIPESDIVRLTEILIRCPDLAHFVGDSNLFVGMMLGAKGCYSYWVNTLPGWQRQYMDACLAGDWPRATTFHKKLLEWELGPVQPLRDAGHRHGITGKARARLSGFLEDTGITRGPYYPVASELQRQLKADFDRCWAAEIRSENVCGTGGYDNHPRRESD